MKAVVLFLIATVFVSVAAVGQGQFVFNNRVLPDMNAPFQLNYDPSTVLAGNAYTVQILGGPTGGPLMPLATTDFRTGAAAGYVNPLTITVPGVPDHHVADILLRIYRGTVSTGVLLGEVGPYQTAVSEAPNLPPNLFLGTNPIALCGLCPEPRAMVLTLGGFAGVLLVLGRERRRIEPEVL